MAGHDHHRHVEISDGERVVAAAEVTANGHACPRSGECAAAQAVADAVAKAAGPPPLAVAGRSSIRHRLLWEPPALEQITPALSRW